MRLGRYEFEFPPIEKRPHLDYLFDVTVKVVTKTRSGLYSYDKYCQITTSRLHAQLWRVFVVAVVLAGQKDRFLYEPPF